MEESECCGAGRLYDTTDLCGDCREHSGFNEVDE